MRSCLRPAAWYALWALVLGSLTSSLLSATEPASRWIAGPAAQHDRFEPPTDEPSQRWRVVLRGTVEEPPVVAGVRALVSVKISDRERQLVVLDLETGRQLTQQHFATSGLLGIELDGSTLAVRTQPGRVEFMTFERDRLLSGRVVTGQSVSPATFAEGGIALMIRDAALLGIHPDETQPRWIVPGSWRGRVAVYGELAFAVRYERGVAQLCQIHAATGKVLASKPVGDHGGATPDPSDVGPRPVILDGAVWLRFDRPLRAQSKTQRFSTSRVLLRADGSLGDRVTLHSLLHDPVQLASGVLVGESSPTGERWVLESSTTGKLRVLADADHAPELLQAPAPASGGGMIYLGRDVVDTHDQTVRFQLTATPTTRPVPVDFGVLITTAPRILELHASEPTVDPAREAARSIKDEVDAKLGSGFAALARLAIKAQDEQLGMRLVRAAEARGARSRDLTQSKRTLEQWIRAARESTPRIREADAVRSKERALQAAGDRELVLRASRASASVRHELLEDVLQRNPAHEQALAELARSLPVAADVIIGDPLGWLEVSTLKLSSRLQFVDADSTDSFARERLATERARWRADAIAVATDRLVLVAPPTVPGALAQSVRLGELVCDCLDEIFGVANKGKTPAPLTLIVHPDRESYTAFADESISGWSAGHYDPNENLCRLYLPADGDALELFRSTYVHELTHHWISSRAPFVRRAADRSGESDTPSFWLCEGFATLVEEFRFDIERGTWEAHDPRAYSLDVIASADENDLLDWRKVLGVSQEEFLALPDTNQKILRRRYILGGSAVVSDKRLFYLQAAAAAHYLFQQRDRVKLLDALAAWYQDKVNGVRVRDAFGLDADSLGRDIQAWARSVAGSEADHRRRPSNR